MCVELLTLLCTWSDGVGQDALVCSDGEVEGSLYLFADFLLLLAPSFSAFLLTSRTPDHFPFLIDLLLL